MKNILLVISTPGDSCQDGIALVPEDNVNLELLQEINGHWLNANDEDLSEEATDYIVEIYERLGFETSDRVKDLKKYLSPAVPFTVDEVIAFGWCV
jgi:hypothetical protein